MKTSRSEALFAQAQACIPGGVNSAARSFRSVGGTPRFIARGQGARMWDEDGNSYLDYVLSWGPLILGHAHPLVVAALQEAVTRGTSYGAPTALETELALVIIDSIPSIEMVRFVNSGTEATMSALRLARAYTRRTRIITFAVRYHDDADVLLVQADSSGSLLDSPGVTAATASETLTATYNDLATVEHLFEQYPEQIAAVIVEPIASNMGFVLPQPGFLDGLHGLCRKHGALYIFDEVVTGFRAALGGAQAYWRIDPDLTCLGKVIGGGLPVGAYAGKREIMQLVAPAGPVYQAGTLSGNALAMMAGLTTLRVLLQPGVFETISQHTGALISCIEALAEAFDVPIQADYIGAMFGVYFLKRPTTTIYGSVIVDYASAKANADIQRYGQFFHGMLEQGVYFAPSQFETCFLSSAHTGQDIQETLVAVERVFERYEKEWRYGYD